MAVASMPVDYDYPITIPGPSFGDSQCGTALAGGIAAALYHRERTQRGCVVDVSLLERRPLGRPGDQRRRLPERR